MMHDHKFVQDRVHANLLTIILTHACSSAIAKYIYVPGLELAPAEILNITSGTRGF